LKITFVYPSFERHGQAHPELLEFVPCAEYIGPPSLGIASVAAATPEGHEIEFIDDRVTPLSPDHPSDLFALSFFTPAATRALELGDQLRARGKRVVMGGIFPSMMPDLAAEHCDAVVVGEGEPVWPKLVHDAANGDLAPRYQAEGPADLAALKPPRMDLYLCAEREGSRPTDYPLQVSRGCPLACDACVLPLQLGAKTRFHSTENLVATMKAVAKAGRYISFTEDTSFLPGTRKSFRTFIDACLEMQQQGIALKFSYIGITMPMVLNLDPKVLEQLKATKIDRFYLVGGFDPVTRLAFGKGDPVALDKARRSIQRCHDSGIDPYVSFLVGNPDDDEGVFDRVLDFARLAKVDLAEFCVSTPYPGTPLWHRYLKEDRILDRTWKHYNDANVVFRPHQMTPERLQEGYLYLWREFYRGRARDLTTRSLPRRIVQF
jgi:radical SAM superfamily enzyme YgiQ (UPF0313 family)